MTSLRQISFNQGKELVIPKGQHFEFDAEKNMYKTALCEKGLQAVRVLEYLKPFG